ncbi:MAG: histidinol-phosphatase HisJ family protein [Fibrobacterota bacterium]
MTRIQRFLRRFADRDWHLHDSHSHDGQGLPVDFARIARMRGLVSIGFSNHIETLEPSTGRFSVKIPRDLERLQRARLVVEAARKEFPDLEIRMGVEVENNPRCYGVMEEIFDDVPFDYVIGSIHLVDGIPITSPGCIPFLKKHSPAEMYQKYYREMADFMEWGRFDILGHADIIRRYMVEVYPGFRPVIPYDILRNIFTLMRSRGQGIEINTGGLFQAPRDTYPTEEIVEIAMDCGVERFSFGSDAHRPEDTGQGFEMFRKED